MYDEVQEVRDLLRRHHERSIAEWQDKADAAALDGDERRRDWCQGMADDLRAIKLPWENAS